MANNYYTTSQAAKLLSVSSDTVLKWVRAGKIPSYRTPGGHSRIPAEAISALLPGVLPAGGIASGTPQEKPFNYCWDFYAGDDGVSQACLDCVAYKSQARRCYEMREIPEEFGHLRLFCETSCDACDFYQLTHRQARSGLVISKSRDWLDRLSEETVDPSFQLKFASSEYEAAAIIEKFRPDYIVLDCSFGKVRTREICQLLTKDVRIPFTRIILTSPKPKWRDDCDSEIFAWIKKPFSVRQLTELIEGVAGEERQPA